MKKKAVSMLLVLAIALSSVGCQEESPEAATTENVETESNTQTAEDAQAESANGIEDAEKKMMPWINSNVAGAVAENTKAELKDDFRSL